MDRFSDLTERPECPWMVASHSSQAWESRTGLPSTTIEIICT